MENPPPPKATIWGVRWATVASSWARARRRGMDRRPGSPRRCSTAGRTRGYAEGMCRNIRPLYNFEPEATREEVRAAALQYVRKISGFTKPSQVNQEAFERAVDEVAHASMHLLQALETNAPPKDREVEAAKARARSAARYAA